MYPEPRLEMLEQIQGYWGERSEITVDVNAERAEDDEGSRNEAEGSNPNSTQNWRTEPHALAVDCR